MFTSENSRPSTPEEMKRIESQIERISNHWVEPLAGASENSQNLMMRLNKGGVTVPYDPNTPAREINLILADSNHFPVAGIHSIEKYWEARTPDGLDRSKLAEVQRHQDQDPNIVERYESTKICTPLLAH